MSAWIMIRAIAIALILFAVACAIQRCVMYFRIRNAINVNTEHFRYFGYQDPKAEPELQDAMMLDVASWMGVMSVMAGILGVLLLLLSAGELTQVTIKEVV